MFLQSTNFENVINWNFVLVLAGILGTLAVTAEKRIYTACVSLFWNSISFQNQSFFYIRNVAYLWVKFMKSL